MTTKQEELDIKILDALLRSMKVMGQHHSSLVTKDGLTLAQWDVLAVLYSQGPLCMNDLIEKSFSTGGNTDVVVNNLIKKKLITRKVDKTDSRKRIIDLTKAGNECVAQLLPLHSKIISNVMGVFTEKEKVVFIELLGKLNNASMKFAKIGSLS